MASRLPGMPHGPDAQGPLPLLAYRLDHHWQGVRHNMYIRCQGSGLSGYYLDQAATHESDPWSVV